VQPATFEVQPEISSNLATFWITSVNVVEIRRVEVTADHAGTVEIWVAIASISGGVSSAIASVCM
jgi:hypothetical protein